MSTSVEWLAVALFLFAMIANAAIEIVWLVRRLSIVLPKAVGFVLATDILGLGIGAFLALIGGFVIFMMVMGPAGRGSDYPSWAYLLVSLVAAALPVLTLFSVKLLGLKVFRILEVRNALRYAALVTLLKLFALGIPISLIYFGVCLFTRCHT